MKEKMLDAKNWYNNIFSSQFFKKRIQKEGKCPDDQQGECHNGYNTYVSQICHKIKAGDGLYLCGDTELHGSFDKDQLEKMVCSSENSEILPINIERCLAGSGFMPKICSIENEDCDLYKILEVPIHPQIVPGVDLIKACMYDGRILK